jgi:hypothetical protein
MMQSHQRLSQYKIQNYENKIIQRLQKDFVYFFWDHPCIFPVEVVLVFVLGFIVLHFP